jgi:chorismate mutase
MYLPTVLVSLPMLALASTINRASECHFKPSVNATATNYPNSTALYDLNTLSSVPVAYICNSVTGNRTEELACARRYIDAIDEQLAFLYSRRLGYASVAGDAKYAQNVSLNDATRNGAVAQGMADRMLKYGGTEDAGRVLGGEGCMIFASLGYEVDKLAGDCDIEVTEKIERVCS